MPAYWDKARSIGGNTTRTIAPGLTMRCMKTVTRSMHSSNKSLDAYSLKAKGGICQQLVANGEKWGLNGKESQ
jgi:hypothetical protein